MPCKTNPPFALCQSRLICYCMIRTCCSLWKEGSCLNVIMRLVYVHSTWNLCHYEECVSKCLWWFTWKVLVQLRSSADGGIYVQCGRCAFSTVCPHSEDVNCMQKMMLLPSRSAWVVSAFHAKAVDLPAPSSVGGILTLPERCTAAVAFSGAVVCAHRPSEPQPRAHAGCPGGAGWPQRGVVGVGPHLGTDWWAQGETVALHCT